MATGGVVATGGVSAEDAPSQGSIGHPFSCKLPCKYHWKKGCKDGKSCMRCHFCPWNPQLGRTNAGNAAAKGKAKAEAKPKEKAEATSAAAGTAKPKTPRSQNPATLELEERLNANSSRYVNVSDEELKTLLPRTEDGSVASVGSLLHKDGKCSRCTFFTTPKGCPDGIRCKFCHMHHPKKEEGPGKRKRQAGSDSDSELSGRNSRRNGSKRPRVAECDEHGNSRPSWLREEGVWRDERSSYGAGFAHGVPPHPYGGPHYGVPHHYGPPPPPGAYVAAAGGYGAPPPGPHHGSPGQPSYGNRYEPYGPPPHDPYGPQHDPYGPPPGPPHSAPPPQYNPYDDRRERRPPGGEYQHGSRDPRYEQYQSSQAPPPGRLTYDWHHAWPAGRPV